MRKLITDPRCPAAAQAGEQMVFIHGLNPGQILQLEVWLDYFLVTTI